VSSNAIRPTWSPFNSALSAEERLVFSLRLMSGMWDGTTYTSRVTPVTPSYPTGAPSCPKAIAPTAPWPSLLLSLLSPPCSTTLPRR